MEGDAPPTSWLHFAGALLLGGSMFVGGVLVRLGRFRSPLRYDGNDAVPRWIRHMPFTLIPFGLAFLLMTPTFLLGEVGSARSVAISLLVTAPLIIAAAVAGLAISWHPPSWIKPRWLEQSPAAPADDFAVGRLQWWVGWAVAGTALALAIVLRLPPYVAGGIGMGMLVLAAASRRGR